MPIKVGEEIKYISLVDWAFDLIRSAIIKGDFKPGQPLREGELVKTMNVSKSPIREAIKKLEAQNLVEIVPHHGAFVVKLSTKDIADLMDVREALDGMAARLACGSVSQVELKKAYRRVNQIYQNIVDGSLSQYLTDDFDFHLFIARAGNNPKLVSSLETILDQIRLAMLRSGSTPGRAHKTLEEHRAVLEALEKGDPQVAEARMRRHIRKAKESMLKIMSVFEKNK